MKDSQTAPLTAVAAEMAKALELMIDYSRRPESWQDHHEEYPQAAIDAINKYQEWKHANGI